MPIHATPIYAGDTPLASTLTVRQSGPMALTVSAGAFTTTGEARITQRADEVPAPVAEVEIAAGRAERLADGRLRLWLLDEQGEPWRPSRTHLLADDVAFTLVADATAVKRYTIELGLVGGVPTLLCRSQIAGEAAPDPPADWELGHWLVNAVIPPGTADLADVPIAVFTVVPGFPAGTTGADWLVQRGGR